MLRYILTIYLFEGLFPSPFHSKCRNQGLTRVMRKIFFSQKMALMATHNFEITKNLQNMVCIKLHMFFKYKVLVAGYHGFSLSLISIIASIF